MEVPEPRTVRWMGDRDMGIFYGEEEVGAKGEEVLSFQL
jgi:hypothetical protein